MPGFVALLSVFAALSAGFSSSVEDGSAAAVNSSAVPRPQSSGPGADRAGCPGRCRCSVDGLLHRVDCSDLGLRDVPGNLSVFTSYL